MKRSMVLLAGCLALLVCGCSVQSRARSHAGASPDVRLARILEETRSEFGVPELAAALVLPGAPVRSAVVGVREVDTTESAEQTDLFHIGSCSKPMTADLLGIFVEEGRLSWRSTLGELLPDIAMRSEYRDVTLEQVLSHYAGLPPYKEADDAEIRRLSSLGDGDAVKARRAFVSEVLQVAPTASPGKERIYSNAGYALAAHIAERLGGSPWESLLRERLLRPLGMRSCRFSFPATRTHPRQPRGHTATGSKVVAAPLADDAEMLPALATGMSCSVDDFARFAAFHLDALLGLPTAGPLSSGTVRKLHSPIEGGHTGSALGWGVNESSFGGTASTILGSLEIFTALVVILPERHAALVVMTNVGEEGPGKPAVLAAAKRIADSYLSAPPHQVPRD